MDTNTPNAPVDLGPRLPWEKLGEAAIYDGKVTGAVWRCGNLLLETHRYNPETDNPDLYVLSVTIGKSGGESVSRPELIDALCVVFPPGSRLYFEHLYGGAMKREALGPIDMRETVTPLGSVYVHLTTLRFGAATFKALMAGEVPAWDWDYQITQHRRPAGDRKVRRIVPEEPA